MRLTVTGPPMTQQVCAHRLDGVATPRTAHRADGSLVLDVNAADAGPPLACEVAWEGEANSAAASEATVQARCGLMHLHGLESGRPQRLGVEVASVAAGMLAAHGVLAALVGRRQGHAIERVGTSVLHAGLLCLQQYLARATSGEAWGSWVPAEPGPAPGPPFRTADGHWIELEAFDPAAWRRFWTALGAHEVDLARAWTLFTARYSLASCALPAGLHERTAQHPLGALARMAADSGVTLTRVRDSEEVLVDTGLAGADRPQLRGLAAPGEAHTHRQVPGQGDGPAEEGPLAGVRVVEATSRLQGPLGGLLLAMLGAEVVRIEPPGGDVNRITPPAAGDVGAFFLTVNRGKQPVELDLTSADGRRELADRIADADVFLHNWRPGKAGEWQLDAHHLAARNPRLVYCCASGWGQTDAGRTPATEFLVQAHTGLGAVLHPEDVPPVPSRLLLTDVMGGLLACEGALLGLLERDRCGWGQRVDTALVGGAMALQHHVLADARRGREPRRRRGRPCWDPLDRPLATPDGYLVVTADAEDRWRRLCKLCEIHPEDAPTRAEAERRVCEQLEAHPAAQWEPILREAGIPCSRVATDLASLARDPSLAGVFDQLPGGCRAPTTPWRFD